jgi:hypothetical protein
VWLLELAAQPTTRRPNRSRITPSKSHPSPVQAHVTSVTQTALVAFNLELAGADARAIGFA